MDYKPDPEKQIHQVGLVKAGERAYKCRYPVLLAEWLKGRGLVEVAKISPYELSRLALVGAERTVISIRESGSVRVSGSQAGQIEHGLQEILRE